MRSWFAVAALLLLSGALRADTAAEARAKIVAPFLDSQVIGVVRLDVSRTDPEALAKRVAALELDQAMLAKEVKTLGEIKKQFTDAGVKEVYWVISLADLPESTLLVVPLAAGKDEKPIGDILRKLGLAGLERRGDAVGAGTEATLKRLRDLKPDPRADLVKAFEALGDNADAEIVLLPPAELRKAIDETMPKLPAEVGGGSSKVLTDGLRWAGARLKLAPKIEIEFIAQARDADTARSLRDLARKAAEHAVKHDDVKQIVPKSDKLASLLVPEVRGDRLGVKVTEDQLLAADLLSGVMRASDRVRSMNNLRQLGLALHAYHDANGTFPAAASYKDGKPLLSWRVHILPYVEQQSLYKQFKLDEPWDSEHNKKLIARMPALYRTPGARDRAGFTSYLGVVGKSTMFTGEKGVALREVVDGTSNTIFLVETDDDHAVEWTKPADLTYNAMKPLTGIRSDFNALFVDGSVRYFAKPPNAKVMKALLTRNGGEVVDIP